jgi:hypothetical protein
MPQIEHWLQNHILDTKRDVDRCRRTLRKSSDGMRPLCEMALREAEIRAAHALNWTTKST